MIVLDSYLITFISIILLYHSIQKKIILNFNGTFNFIHADNYQLIVKLLNIFIILFHSAIYKISIYHVYLNVFHLLKKNHFINLYF